jgi:hypothetical protein
VAVPQGFLGVQKQDISLAETWSKTAPLEAGGKPLYNFLNKVQCTGIARLDNYSLVLINDRRATNPFYYDCYHEYDQFRADHEHLLNKPAYVGPQMQYIWYVCGSGPSTRLMLTIVIQGSRRSHYRGGGRELCCATRRILKMGYPKCVYNGRRSWVYSHNKSSCGDRSASVPRRTESALGPTSRAGGDEFCVTFESTTSRPAK